MHSVGQFYPTMQPECKVNILRREENSWHSPLDKCNFLIENCYILTKYSLNFVPKGLIEIIIGSGNGLVTNKWQANTWTDVDEVPGQDKLMK